MVASGSGYSGVGNDTMAEAQGDKKAAENSDFAQIHMTPAQVAEGQKLSRELFERLKK